MMIVNKDKKGCVVHTIAGWQPRRKSDPCHTQDTVVHVIQQLARIDRPAAFHMRESELGQSCRTQLSVRRTTDEKGVTSSPQRHFTLAPHIFPPKY